MINPEKFKKYIKKLELAFEHRGFKVSELGVVVWFDRLKSLSEEEFIYCVNMCIDTCETIPSIAAILKHRVSKGNEITPDKRALYEKILAQSRGEEVD